MEEGATLVLSAMNEILEKGLNQILFQFPNYLQELAERIFDYQIPTIARKLKDLDRLTLKKNYVDHSYYIFWITQLAIQIKKIEHLNFDQKISIWQDAGGTISKVYVKNQVPITDNWLLVHQRFEKEDSLNIEKSWLLGLNQNKFICQIQYAFGNQKNLNLIPKSKSFKAQAYVYPGHGNYRAIIENIEVLPSQNLYKKIAPTFHTIHEMKRYQIDFYLKNPTLDEHIFTLDNVRPIYLKSKLLLIDIQLNSIPLDNSEILFSKYIAFCIQGYQKIMIQYFKGRYSLIDIFDFEAFW